nr:Dihydrofolate reductase [uncultured bacterium]
MKVFIIAAVTADGLIGATSDHAADWTSKEDKQLFKSLTTEAGVMVMGSNTYKTIDRALPGRQTIVYTHNADPEYPEGVTATTKPAAELIAELNEKGVTAVAICGGAQIYDLFLRSGVVTELYLTIEPVLFGQGIHLFKSATFQKLELMESRKLNDNVLLAHYKLLAE